MQSLSSFDLMTSSLKLQGDLLRAGESLKLIFELHDPENLCGLPGAFEQPGLMIPREQGLWNDTCFEMFLRPVGSPSYHEFNFSLKPAWNVYHFLSYRTPQPPMESHDFKIQSLKWDGGRLEVDLLGLNTRKDYTASTPIQVGMAAVLKQTSGAKHFMALKHGGEKPDFHLAESFILKA